MNRLPILTATACILFGLAGCTSTKVSQALSSGAVGCPPSEIEIVGEDVYRNVHTFTAVCRGKSYACTYIHPSPISCTPTKS